ncbi:hypothetical protein, partial [Neisseria gonorrhoeae]|uniref:hypothetical protein n=2 Tax=Neisseria gonorrhoeae TaxID=485 RepID=UPI001C92F583
IPAFAGMTNFRFLFLVFCPCRNDEILSFRNLSGATETAPPSFPRGRESGPLVRQMGGRVARLSDKNRV